jgi:hypothetical protein
MPDVTVRLSRPLTTHDGVKHEITLREPTARDYMSLKRVPFSIVFHQTLKGGEMGAGVNPDPGAVTERQGELMTDYDLAFQWISRLSGIDTLILGTLRGSDVNKLINGLRDIVGDTADDQGDEAKVQEQLKN